MRLRLFAPLVVSVVFTSAPVRAGVVVVGNYTDGTVSFRLAEPGAKPREHTLASNSVAPLFVRGPADVTFTAKGREAKLRLDLYNAYVFLPDPDTGVKLEGLELPGDPLERDARAEVNPAPRDAPVKVPVTVLVDDTEQRADKVWQAALRERFDIAAEVLEKAAGIKFVLAGFGTWKSDPDAQTTAELLAGLEKAVPAKGGGLIVGYTSRKIDPKVDPAFGAGRGLSGRHALVREWTPKSELERQEVLVHFLAESLGGVGSPDPGSALRSPLGDGYVLRQGAVLRFDPLNVLTLNIWADERRRDPGVTWDSLSNVSRTRLTRVYKALLGAAPGDSLAIEYLEALDREVAKNPAPKSPPRPPVNAKARDELARSVVRAVRERARANAAPGANALKGDDLTAEYVRVAVEAALRSPGPEAVPGFLLGLGVALDDTGALFDDAVTADAVKSLETVAERKERVAALGNPTLAGRRDLCRRFFLGCAVGELASDGAESVAAGRVASDLRQPANLCLPALAAEFAGITFARAAVRDPDLLYVVAKSFSAGDYLPPLQGLRDGLSPEKFEQLYGGTSDARFHAVVADVRARLSELKAYK